MSAPKKYRRLWSSFPPVLAILVWSICAAPSLAVGGGTGSDNGAVALLVKSRVPLTPEVVAAISGHAVRVSYVWPEINAMALSATPARIAELVADPYVEIVEPDELAGISNEDPELANGAPEPTSVIVPILTSTTPIQTWNLDMADTAGSGFDGTGVTVAVVDSGLPQNWREFLPENSVDVEHAAGFGPEGAGDFHNPVNAIRGVGGHIGLFPHGLAVSGVIVGFPSDFGPVGGAAAGAKILPIRVLNQFNGGMFSWYTAAFLYVANLKAGGAIPGPIVINFSIQSRGFNVRQVVTDAINYAISRGVLFVTIAGNFGPAYDSISFPGRLPQAITAGSAGWRREGQPPQPWFFGDVLENDAGEAYVPTSSGRESLSVPPASHIDVLAPGSYVFGEWAIGPGFSEGREVAFDAFDNLIFGTSFAAPHVAGIVAQMLQKNPSLTQSEAEGILRSTAIPLPASPVGFFTSLGGFVYPWDAQATGAGLVRGTAAVAATPGE